MAALTLLPIGELAKLAEPLGTLSKVFDPSPVSRGPPVSRPADLPVHPHADSCLSNSFTGDTAMLMADGTPKPISAVKVGDKVLATDSTTGETAARTVTGLITGTGPKNLVAVTVDTDGQTGDRVATVEATDRHPFWVDAAGPGGRWTDSVDLRAGDILTMVDGRQVTVDDTRTYTRTTTVYNLTVADLHTYYVLAGATPVLVHNCGEAAEVASEGPQSLYHYTNEAGHDGIISSGEMRPSLKTDNPKDARYGDGQYLTDIKPGTKTLGQLSAAFLRVPWAGCKFTHYIEIDVRGLEILEGRSGVRDPKQWATRSHRPHPKLWKELEMRYVKVAWDHDLTNDPVLYLSELGDDGYETRKVQFYRNGRSEWANESFETATVGLSEIPFPSLQEISSQPEFTAEVITPEEFERAWKKAHANS